MPYHPTSAYRLAWVDVDSTAIEQNTRRLCQISAPAVVIGVVKAEGYSHGALQAARAMLAGGAWGLAVATTGEGRRLRAAGIYAPILVIGYTPPERIADALQDNLAISIGDAAALHTAAAIGQATGRPVALHLKIDTGMHRLGLLPHEVGPFLDAAHGIEGVSWEGIYTHFAAADEPWREQTAIQLARFEDVLAGARASGWRFPIIHAANSAAAIWHPAARYDAVRAGIALYGVAPADEAPLPEGFRPALAFRARVVRVTQLPPGSPISYGGIYSTHGQQRIATIAVGYADGLRRVPAWREVLVHGQRAAIVGRICMDYAMVDVTGIAGVEIGDEVTLIGSQGADAIGAEEVARWLGTSAYEVLTSLGFCQMSSNP